MPQQASRGRPSPALVISLIALFISIGGVGYAAATIGTNDIANRAVTAKKLHKNAVATTKIQAGAVNGAKVEDHSLTGADLTPAEPYHEIGAAGEPRFQNGAHNFGDGFSTAGFFIDHEHIVHLKGTVTATRDTVIFNLPPGYRPGQELFIPTIATGNAGRLFISPNGDVEVGGPVQNSANYALDSITFRAPKRG
jgi:hypothetical protein